MKIAVVGHSLIHIRQQKFYEHVAALGHEVHLLAPIHWNDMVIPTSSYVGNVHLWGLPVERIFIDKTVAVLESFYLSGMTEKLDILRPNVIYVNQEPNSAIARLTGEWARSAGIPAVLFTWENQRLLEPRDIETLKLYSYVVCGNPEAFKAVTEKAHVPASILPQVGVDMDHFASRDTERVVDVGYIGRDAPEKGVDLLRTVWPGTKVLKWCDWKELPWRYSQCKIIVCYSQDTSYWKEQAMPYVAVEALASKCSVVVSNGGSIPYWMKTAPNTIIADQHDLTGLKTSIELSLHMKNDKDDEAGRAWVQRHLSSQTVASGLCAILKTVAAQR